MNNIPWDSINPIFTQRPCMLHGLYRGISTVTKKWVYGYLTSNKEYNLYFINEGTNSSLTYEVYPQSIGIYIGRKDIEDNKIYTGDKIQVPSEGREAPNDYYVVEWYPRGITFLGTNGYLGDIELTYSEVELLVIGTVFDELLEVL